MSTYPELLDSCDRLTARVDELEQALTDLLNVAVQCDSWESFPADSIRAADDTLGEQK
jgi:hypothetical protein